MASGLLLSCADGAPQGFAFKIAVVEDGVVRVGFDDLGYSGPPLPTSQLLLTERGHPVAIEVEDGGALPFVLMARMEVACRRAIPGLQTRWVPPGSAPSRTSRRDRFRRSRLYLPGNEPKYMLNAGLHEPDAIILDLEDSVAAAEKDSARVLVRNALAAVDFGAAERMVRMLLAAFLMSAVPLFAHADEARDLLRVDASWNELRLAGDARKLDALLADDWLLTHSDGRVQTKAEYLQELSSRRRSNQAITNEDVKTRMVDVHRSREVLTRLARPASAGRLTKQLS